MVVRTTSLNSLKNFLPKIHQTLLTRRESQQLLDSITSSFRKNLDKEHPWEHNEDLTSQKPITQATKTILSAPSHSASLPDRSSRQLPTDRHLGAILSNPLFAHEENKKPATVPRDPFDVFDYAVSRGLMTPRRAAGFLAKVRSQITGESADDIRQGMAKSGAGLRVVQWLRASGLENDLQFLSHPSLFAALIPFMYAEGLEEVVWYWVAHLGAREETDGKARSWQDGALSALLNAIVKQTNTSYSGLKMNLDHSYEAIVRANDLLPMQNQIALKSFKKTWVGLSWASTVFASERPKPSAPLFESFINIGRPLHVQLDMAHLDLHHPLTPNHSAAIQFMHNNAHPADLRPTTRRRLVSLALDAADRLKEVGDVEQASWVERFLSRIGNDLTLGILNPERDLIASELPIHRMW